MIIVWVTRPGVDLKPIECVNREDAVHQISNVIQGWEGFTDLSLELEVKQ